MSETTPPWEHFEAAAWLAYADVRQAEGADRDELIALRTTGMSLLEPRELVLMCQAIVIPVDPKQTLYESTMMMVCWPRMEIVDTTGRKQMRVRCYGTNDYMWRSSESIRDWIEMWRYDHSQEPLRAVVISDFPLRRPKGVELDTYALMDRQDGHALPAHKPTDFDWICHPQTLTMTRLVRDWYTAQYYYMDADQREYAREQAELMTQGV